MLLQHPYPTSTTAQRQRRRCKQSTIVSEQLKNIINEVGLLKSFAVVTDNAPEMMAAFMQDRTRYKRCLSSPHLPWKHPSGPLYRMQRFGKGLSCSRNSLYFIWDCIECRKGRMLYCLLWLTCLVSWSVPACVRAAHCWTKGRRGIIRQMSGI